MTDINKEFKYDIEAIPGERWFPKESNFEDDMNEYWGDWGVSSEVDTLKAVLLRRPGKEVEDFDPNAVRFSDEPLDVELMRKQHDDVAKIYTDFGAKVYYVEETREDRPNAVFCRDPYETRHGSKARRREIRSSGFGEDRRSHPEDRCRRRHVRGRKRHVGRQTYLRSFHGSEMQQERLRTGKTRVGTHGC